MKTIIAILSALFFIGCAGMQSQPMTEFAIETMAMGIGYELQEDFEWTESVDQYYAYIMEGTITLDGAKAAEAYLASVTHPLIADRMITLAGMAGFTLDAGQIVGVERVNIRYLQVAASGFRSGLNLK